MHTRRQDHGVRPANEAVCDFDDIVIDLAIGHTYYLSHNLQCILPIDYMISKNIGPRLLTLCPMIALWFNFIVSTTCIAKSNKPKETEPLS